MVAQAIALEMEARACPDSTMKLEMAALVLSERRKWLLGQCYISSKIALEVAFKVAVRRISAQIPKTLFDYNLLRTYCSCMDMHGITIIICVYI